MAQNSQEFTMDDADETINVGIENSINTTQKIDIFKLSLEELQEQLAKTQSELLKKETKVNRLKGLLTRSMRNDKRNQTQIETLQFDLADKDRYIASINKELEEQKEFSNKQAMRISELESEISDLTQKLQNGSGSENAQKKIERLKQMLDRSQTLYAELHTKYQQTFKELTEKNKHHSIPTPKVAIILSDEESFVLNENETYIKKSPQKHYPDSIKVYDLRHSNEVKSLPKKDNSNFLKTYLKKVLLEFFVGDTPTQFQLVPIILSILECSQEQITAAQRSYAEGRQIISKATMALNL